MKKGIYFVSIIFIFLFIVSHFGVEPAFADSTFSSGDTSPVSVDISGNVTIFLNKGLDFTITGNATFVPGTSGVVTYNLKSHNENTSTYSVGAVGDLGSSTGLYLLVPGQPAQRFCVLFVAEDPNMAGINVQSDTSGNLTLAKGSTYQFKITSQFNMGTNTLMFETDAPNVVSTQRVEKRTDDDVYYFRVTAIGETGQSAGIYTYLTGQGKKKICTVTVGQKPAEPILHSDTTQDFAVLQNSSYQLKITSSRGLPIRFTTGTSGVFSTFLAKHTGNDYYYKITAVGKPGSSTGLYMAVPGQPAQKICIASVFKSGYFISDTNNDFTLITESPYTFKITAPGAKTVNLTAGIGNDVWVSPVKRSGNNFYFTIRSNPPLIESGYADPVKKVVFMYR